MSRRIAVFLFVVLAAVSATRSAREEKPALEVGLAEVDITPRLGGRPVYLAGFGHNRIATGVHDPLFARAIVLRHGQRKLALVSIDVVGFFIGEVKKVRQQLPGFDSVTISSTHNHEGPDTMGLWGKTPFQSGLDPDYQTQVRKAIVAAVKEAEGKCRPVQARIGTVKAPQLLHDTRKPIVKHDDLVVLEFLESDKPQKRAGLLVQWNCHPETLDSKNTRISADFVGPTVKALKEKYRCPVVYLTGTVGGLMTSLHVEIRTPEGKLLDDGTFEKTERYGQLLAEAAGKALQQTQPITLTPWQARTREVFLPVDNKLYQLARQLGVVERDLYLWTGNPNKAESVVQPKPGQALCLSTEVGWLHLGELDIVAIPGEIYPELVLDKVTDPAEPGADFPDAPIEPAVYKQLPGRYRMLIGLANDEIGYIIPKRQWDEKPPFCYGLKKAPYGEINSLGSDTAPLLCKAFQALLQEKASRE